ncbi:MAG TPA: metal-dependent hydrolase [Abditibacterium sp.]
MMAPTHALIGVLSYTGVCAVIGTVPAPLGLGCAALGAWLPDADTPSSRVGLCLYPFATWMERRFGHRTVTHSLLGVALFALLIAPLLFFGWGALWFSALLCGYASHLLADAATKAGVPLLWPSRARFVFPGNDALRFVTGSKAELTLLVCLFLLGALLIPFVHLGPRRLLHLATRSMAGASRDAEDWGEEFQLFARVEGFDVLSQKLVKGDFSVVGRRDDGTLVIEGAQPGLPSGYKLLQSQGAELERIAPRRVTILQGEPRRDQTRTIRVANISLAALSRALTQSIPPEANTQSDAEIARRANQNFKAGREYLNIHYLHPVLVSGSGECYPFPQNPQFAPVDFPQFGLKAVAFTGSKVSFDFAQPRHLTGAGTRVVLKNATLTLRLPRGAKLPNLVLPTSRRIVTVPALRRQSDLFVRTGDLIRRGEPLGRPFAQHIEHDPTPAELQQERDAESARRELRALDIEELALKKRALSTWGQMAASYAQRRQSLEAQARYAPPAPKNEPLPPIARAPFDAVVEGIEWEPPTLPTRQGELPQHSARVSLVQILR